MHKYISVLSTGMLMAGLQLWAMPAEASVWSGVKKVAKFTVAAPLVVIGVGSGVVALGCGAGLAVIYREELDQTFAGKMTAKYRKATP